MIKNSRRRGTRQFRPVAWGVLLVASAACDRADRHPGAYQGVVEFDERRLGFELGGRLREVKVDEGDEVAPGQLLASLDDEIERTAHLSREQEAVAARAQTSLVRAGPRVEEIRSMAAQVEAARAQEQLLATNLARERRLLADGASTEATVQDLESRQRGAAAERRSFEERLRQLRSGARSQEVEGAEARAGAAAAAAEVEVKRLRLYQLQAVEKGTVLDVNVEPGEVVAAGTPVVTIADTRHPYVDVFVPQGELAGIAVGAAAEVAVDSLVDRLPGRVEHVGRRTEFTPRYIFSEKERPNLVVRVRVRIDDPGKKLHAGIPATARFAAGAGAASAARTP